MNCSICKNDKPITEFSYRKDRKSGIYTRCKECEKKRTKKYKGRYVGIYNHHYYLCKNKWLPYLQLTYGEFPKCQCCQKSLNWNTKIFHDRVCLDHRNGGSEIIKKSPTAWIAKNTFNEKNKQLFNSCNFGILCHQCNRSMPTKNRDEWLCNVTNYIKIYEQNTLV